LLVVGCWLLVVRCWQRWLFGGAVFAAGVGYAGDEPFSVGADEVEEIGAAVVDLAVGEEVKGSPDYGEVVVDADEGIVDALFYLRGRLGCAGFTDSVGEAVGGHLAGVAVAHEDHGCSGDEGGLDGGGVAVGHAGEESVHWSEDSLFFWSLGVEGGGKKNADKQESSHVWDCNLWVASPATYNYIDFELAWIVGISSGLCRSSVWCLTVA